MTVSTQSTIIPPMLNVTGIAFALYHVTDVARARKFYGETLGLKVCMEMEFAPGKWWIEYDAGGAAKCPARRTFTATSRPACVCRAL